LGGLGIFDLRFVICDFLLHGGYVQRIEYGRSGTNDVREPASSGLLLLIAICGVLSTLVGAITVDLWWESHVYRRSGENYASLLLITVRPVAVLVQFLLLGFYLAFMSTPKKVGWIGIVSGILTALACVAIALSWIVNPN
jgi:hypothetical protein